MQINLTGHGIDLTPALRTFVNEKFDRLKRRTDGITNIHVVLEVEKMQQIAKTTLFLDGHEMHAHAESADLYSAIDLMIDKLDHQITKYRDKLKNHHHRERENMDAAIAIDE